VIDQESTDNTVKIAKKFGAKVINVEYERNARAHRVGNRVGGIKRREIFMIAKKNSYQLRTTG
jgi:glycosyltransferase involved in cell wall biosynthesis